MKITICGSLAFFDQMVEARERLEAMGHEVKMPPENFVHDKFGDLGPQERWELIKANTDVNEDVRELKEAAMRWHLDKVAWSDVVLILNEEKKGIPGYVGGNTLLEMGVAFHMKKTIYLMNGVPEIDYKDEIVGMRPVILNGDLSVIK